MHTPQNTTTVSNSSNHSSQIQQNQPRPPPMEPLEPLKSEDIIISLLVDRDHRYSDYIRLPPEHIHAVIRRATLIF